MVYSSNCILCVFVLLFDSFDQTKLRLWRLKLSLSQGSWVCIPGLVSVKTLSRDYEFLLLERLGTWSTHLILCHGQDIADYNSHFRSEPEHLNRDRGSKNLCINLIIWNNSGQVCCSSWLCLQTLCMCNAISGVDLSISIMNIAR